MTNIAIMLAFVHFPFAFGASVSGSKMSETAALNSRSPNKSISTAKFFIFWTGDWPRNTLPISSPNLFARR
jgi:hypothetical protein